MSGEGTGGVISAGLACLGVATLTGVGAAFTGVDGFDSSSRS